MVFELGRVAGGAAERLTSRGPLRTMSNPILATIIVTVLAMVLIFAFLDKGGSLSRTSWRERFRCGFYLFMGVGLLLALHYYGLSRKLNDAKRTSANQEFISQVHTAQSLPPSLQQQSSSYVPIRPGSLYSQGMEPPLGFRPGQALPQQPGHQGGLQPGQFTLPAGQSPGLQSGQRPPGTFQIPPPPAPGVQGGDDLELTPLSFPLQ